MRWPHLDAVVMPFLVNNGSIELFHLRIADVIGIKKRVIGLQAYFLGCGHLARVLLPDLAAIRPKPSD